MGEIVVVLHPDGTMESLYEDGFPFGDMGSVEVLRTGHVRWDPGARAWFAELFDGRRSQPFALRTDAVAWERAMVNMDLAEGKFASSFRLDAMQAKYVDPEVPHQGFRELAACVEEHPGPGIHLGLCGLYGSREKVLDAGIGVLADAGLTTLIGLEDRKAYSLVVRLVRWPKGDDLVKQTLELEREPES